MYRIHLLLVGSLLLGLASPSLAAEATLLSRLTGTNLTVVEAVGDHVYAASGGFDGLHVFDVSDPSSPTYLASLQLAGGTVTPIVRDMDHHAGHLYVASYNYGFEVYDLADPVAPTLVATVTDADDIQRLEVVGDLLYVLDVEEDLFIYDISGAAPSLLGSENVNSDHDAYDFVIDGTDVYISRARLVFVEDVVFTDDSVIQLDVSNPLNPVPVAVPLSGDEYYYYPFVADGVLYATTAPGETTSFTLPGGGVQSTWPEEARRWFPEGSGFLVDTATGISFFDGGATLATLPLGGDGIRADRDGDRLVRGAGLFGLQVVDVSDPLDMALLGDWKTAGSGSRIVTGMPGIDYITGGAGLRALDVSDPLHPEVVWSFDDEARAVVMDEAGQMLYAHFTDSRTLRVFDLTDPAQPQLVREMFPVNGNADLQVRAGLLYVGNSSGLKIYDASDPATSLDLLGSLDPGGPFAFALRGSYAYLCEYNDGHVVDITDPTDPELLASFSLGQSVQTQQVAILGDRLFAIGYSATGAAVISLADPELPVATGEILPGSPGIGYGIHSDGNLLALSARNGLFVYDITLPASPALELTLLGNPQFQVRGAAFRGSQLHVVGPNYHIYSTTLGVVAVAPPRAPARFLGAFPNPFNPRTVVSFSAPKDAAVRVDVLDLRGRRVAVLFEGRGTGQRQEVAWAPRDIASGVYLVRLQSGDESDTRKVSLLK